MENIGNILVTILKFIGKIILIALWGGSRLGEVLLQQINKFLASIITKSN